MFKLGFKSRTTTKARKTTKATKARKATKVTKAKKRDYKKGDIQFSHRLKGHCTARTRPVFKTTYRQTIGWLNPSNTGLWLLLRNFSFGFLHFVLSQPDPFHVFDDIMSLKHLFRRWKALRHIFFTWEGNIWRIAKGSTMVKGLIHSQKKQSNPLVTQITAIFVALLPTTLVASFGFMAGPSVSAARGSSTFACSNHAICWKQKQT